MPPFLTFGHETLISSACTPSAADSRSARVSYSSTVLPTMFTMTLRVNRRSKGTLAARNAFRPTFWRPMALSSPEGVSIRRGAGLPARGSSDSPLTAIAPRRLRSRTPAYSSPYPNVPEAAMTGLARTSPPPRSTVRRGVFEGRDTSCPYRRIASRPINGRLSMPFNGRLSVPFNGHPQSSPAMLIRSRTTRHAAFHRQGRHARRHPNPKSGRVNRESNRTRRMPLTPIRRVPRAKCTPSHQRDAPLPIEPDLQHLVFARPRRRDNRDEIAHATADQGLADRRMDRNPAHLQIDLDVAHQRELPFFTRLRVGDGDRGAEHDLFHREIGRVDHLGVHDRGFEFADPALDERLPLLGGRVLGVLAQVPVRPRLGDLLDVLGPFHPLEALELFLERLEPAPCHRNLHAVPLLVSSVTLNGCLASPARASR